MFPIQKPHCFCRQQHWALGISSGRSHIRSLPGRAPLPAVFSHPAASPFPRHSDFESLPKAKEGIDPLRHSQLFLLTWMAVVRVHEEHMGTLNNSLRMSHPHRDSERTRHQLQETFANGMSGEVYSQIYKKLLELKGKETNGSDFCFALQSNKILK